MTHSGTASIARYGARDRRPNRDLLGRTALCGALLGLVALASSPANALPVLTGAPQVAGGGAPGISSGAGSTNITLNAPRTVIDWTSYNVGGGEAVHYTFSDRGWIVLNRIGGSTTPTIAGVVDGRVNGAYGGNIWFASRNGMIFSSGASMDAGGILLSVAAPDLGGFLSPGNTTFSFPGGDVINQPVINLQSGSAITGHGGLVALIAPSIITEGGTQVNGLGGSSVLFGATAGYTLRLQQNAPGDFDLVDFFIPDSSIGSQATVALDLQNTTTANSVFVAAVSRSSASSAVINLQGLVTAQAATSDGGDIILSGGGGIVGRTAAPSVGGTTTDMYLHTMSASRDIVVQNAGQVLAKNFVRPPPPPPIAPPVISPPPPPDNGSGGGNGSYYDPMCDCYIGREPADPSAFAGLLDTFTPVTTRASVADGSRLSNLNAGRDIKLTASRTITLGAARAGRDLTLDSPDLLANTLSAGRTATLTSESGDLDVGSLAIGSGGSVLSAGSVQIDSFSLGGGALSIRAATDIGIGDGSGSASGGTVTLTAGHNVDLALSSANIDTVNAGATANLQAGALKVNTVTGSQVLARGGSVTIGTATSAGDVYVTAQGGSATVGTATAGDDVYIVASGGAASLTKAVLTGAGADTTGAPFAGNSDAAGNGRVVSVQSSDGDALLGLGTGTVTGATAVSVKAGQDVTVDLPTALPGALTVSATRDATLRAPTVTFDAVQAGRDVSLIATVGSFSSNRSLVATRNITIGAPGALQLADISAASGSITLTGSSVTAGAVSAGQDLTLKATGGAVTLTSFKAGRDLVIQGSTLSLGQQLAPIGRDLSITSPGDFTSASDLAAGRNLTLTIGGNASLRGLSSPGDIGVKANNLTIAGAVTATGNIGLTATNLTINGAVTTAAGTVDLIASDLTLGAALSAANVQIESATGALRVGGSSADTAPASGLWLDNAEFGRIHATGVVNLYAGPIAGAARGDLTLLGLDVTPASTPKVNFLVGGGRNALVNGVVAPTVSGGVVHIGDNTNTAWQPASILVSGTLGSATYSGGAYNNVHGFNDVRLFATKDIILGSPRFISLIQSTANADIEIGRNKPAGVAPVGAEQNRVLVAAGTLELSASGKVVSQNTAPTSAQSVGLFLTAGNGQPDLLIDPPQLVDLYGSFISQAGVVVSSFSAGAGVAFAIVDAAGNPASAPAGAVYRFNSCAVGTSQCSAAASVTSNLQQNTPILTTTTGPALGSDLGADAAGGGESGGGSSGGGKAGSRGAGDRNSPPSLLSVAPVEPDVLLTEPVVTGAGSEEIWRKRNNEAAKPQSAGAKP